MPVLPQQYSEQRAQFSEVFNLRSTELHFCFVSAASASMLETRPINKSPTPIYCPKSLGSPFLSIPESKERRVEGQTRVTRLERVASLKCSFTLARFSCIALCALNYCRTASFFQCAVIHRPLVPHHRVRRCLHWAATSLIHIACIS